MLEYVKNLLDAIDPFWAYVVLTVSAFLENVIPPIPGDTVVVFGAYLVSIDKLGFWGVYASTTLGSVTGFFTMYLLGLKYGRGFIQHRRIREKIFKPQDIKKVEVWFGRWGYWVIFANRFLSGTRSVISIFAGLFHLHPLPVIALAMLSAMIWNAILILAGMLLGEKWQDIVDIVTRYNQIFIALTVLIFLIVIYRLYKKRSARTYPENED
jgi:membrane protein DedA with SNARE-associated domain